MLTTLSWSDSMASTSAWRASSIRPVGRLADVVGRGDVGDDLGLDPDPLQARRLMLSGPLAPDGAIREAEAAQVPEQAGGDVVAAAEVAEGRAGTAAEAAPRLGHRQAGHERAQPRLLQAEPGRLDQLPGVAQLGAGSQALDDQVLERDLVRDQPDDGLGRLDRRHHHAGFQHQQPDQVGRGDQQLAADLLDHPGLTALRG
jgi:hypothetical protein